MSFNIFWKIEWKEPYEGKKTDMRKQKNAPFKCLIVWNISITFLNINIETKTAIGAATVKNIRNLKENSTNKDADFFYSNEKYANEKRQKILFINVACIV